MTTSTPQRSAGGAIGRSLVAALVMGLGLAIAGRVAGAIGTSAAPSEPLVDRLVVAASVTVVVIAVIVLIRRRWDRAPLPGIGLSGPGPGCRGFLLGLAVVAVPAIAVLAVLRVSGAAEVRDVDGSALALFLVTNALVAVLLEAVPEEIALRATP